LRVWGAIESRITVFWSGSKLVTVDLCGFAWIAFDRSGQRTQAIEQLHQVRHLYPNIFVIGNGPGLFD